MPGEAYRRSHTAALVAAGGVFLFVLLRVNLASDTSHQRMLVMLLLPCVASFQMRHSTASSSTAATTATTGL